jgi:mono/diheme cytochrome c family protein
MSNDSCLGLASGIIGDPNIVKNGPRPHQAADGTMTIGATLTSSGVAAQDVQPVEVIERGYQLFLEEICGGNGRTCAACHPRSNDFAVDPPSGRSRATGAGKQEPNAETYRCSSTST